MPYLFAKAVEAHETGVPMMRAMFVEFPDDPACLTLDRQYMLGDSLLVAPIFSFDDEVAYYVPGGLWTSYIDGRIVEGPGWVREKHGFLSVPLLVRPGTVLPVGAVDDRPDYDFPDGVSFKVYGLEDGGSATCSIPTLAGAVAGSIIVTRAGDEISAVTTGSIRNWSVSFPGVSETVFRPDEGASTLQGIL